MGSKGGGGGGGLKSWLRSITPPLYSSYTIILAIMLSQEWSNAVLVLCYITLLRENMGTFSLFFFNMYGHHI